MFDVLFDNVERQCERATEEARKFIPHELLNLKENDDSRYYVYGFYCAKWGDFFYIGKGTGNRINSNRRNVQVKSILDNQECLRVIIADRLTNNHALQIEQILKKKLKAMGKPIIDYECIGYQQNQKEGIERARQQGKYKGRKPAKRDENAFKCEYARYKTREITKTEFARLLGVSRPTLYKILKQHDLS